ncbi:MAG: hypothetical protein AAFV53_18375 [Myxococcota bacterium]
MKGLQRRRLVLAGLALTVWTAGGYAAVIMTQHPLVGVVMGVLLTITLSSLWEWLVHGYMYHGRGLPGMKTVMQIHVAGHHHGLFPPTRYVQDGPYPFMRFRRPHRPWQMSDNALDNALTKLSQVGLHFLVGLPFIVLPAWWFTHDPVFTASTLITAMVISWLLAHVHGCIHTPRGRWIEHQRWFQWLDRHHYIHHIDHQANINFLLPVCDALFGTLKTELTPKEAARWPTFEEAKPMALDIPHHARQQRPVS